MRQPNTFFRYSQLTLSRGPVSAQTVLRLSTLLVWAAVAYSVVGWVLRENPAATATSAVVATSPTSDIDASAVARALGVRSQTAEPAPTLGSRFQLVGVLNGDAATGVALISVDGKPAKPFRVGKNVAEGLVVQSTQTKRVNLGASVDAPTTLSLDLPVKK